MITYFKDKNYNSEKRSRNYKSLTSLIESVDTVVILSSTTTSVTISITGFGLNILPIMAELCVPCS